MTDQLPANTSAKKSQFVAGLMVGVGIGLALLCVGGVLGGVVGYSSVKKKQKEVRAGWNLVPVIVAASDIAENTKVTYDLIAQRPIPEQFVTSSVIKPDSASYIVGQQIVVPVQAGDPLLWSQFEMRAGSTICNQLDRLSEDIVKAKKECEAARENDAARASREREQGGKSSTLPMPRKPALYPSREVDAP
jgi:SAF domain-containing protein